MARPLSRLLQRRVLAPLTTQSAPLRHFTTRPSRPASASSHARRLQPFSRNQQRSLFIQTQPTPNPSALKFHPGVTLLPASSPGPYEFLSGRTSYSSPLARKLFALDGISSIMITPEYLTITITSPDQWPFLKPEVFALITEHLSSGAPVILEGDENLPNAPLDTAPQDGDSEVVAMVKELLDTRIRPAIQEDGGDIEFRGYDEETGTVKVKLRGACRTCDSSTVTLRNGIEGMLMHYIEEVKSVEQVMDEEEIVGQREFEKFEEKLRKVRGERGVASAPLDQVP